VKTLSWPDGVLSGFRLVARRPLAALSWALVFIVGGTILAGFQVAAWQGFAAGRSLSDVAVPLGFGGLVLDVLTTTVASAAVLRATIRPDDRRAAWPRLGGGELRLLVLVAPVTVMSIVIAAPIGIFLLARVLEPGPLATSLALHLAAVMLTAAGARLALAAPATLADGRLRLARALGPSRKLHVRLATLFVAALLLSMAVEWAGSWARDALGLAQPPVLRASSLAAALNTAFGPVAMASRVFGGLVHALAFAVQVGPIGYAFHRLTEGPADRADVF